MQRLGENILLGAGTTAKAPKWFLAPYLVPLTLSWLVLSWIVILSVLVLYMTFVPELPNTLELTLTHWSDIARPFVINKVLPNTLIVGLFTVIIATFFAAPLAWLLHRTTIPFRNMFISLIAVVVIIPGFAKAMGWLLVVNPRIGLLNDAIGKLMGWETVAMSLENPFGMAWIMGLMLTPTMFFLISGPMMVLDPVLEEAAVISRANRWQTLLHVSLPLVWPGILGGAIYIFMTAISIFEVPAMLGGAGKVPVLATEVFYTVHSDIAGEEIKYGAAGVYGVLIAGPSLIALYFYQRVLAKARNYEVITGKGYRPHLVDLGGFTYAGLAFVCLYLILAMGLPMVMLIWASLLPTLQMPSMEAVSRISFDNYLNFIATAGGISVVWNTVILVVSVAVLVVFFSLMTSWIIVRTQLRVRKAMDTISMLPHAIPGLAFAFGLFMLALLAARWVPWLPLLGTLNIVVIANVLNRMAYGTRITNAALLQIHRELEECARVCRAGTIRILWNVVVPLIKPSLIFAGVWTALLTFREVTMALFLGGPKSRVVATAAFNLWQQAGNLTMAAAASVMMVAFMGLLIFAVLAVTRVKILGERV